MTPYLLANPEQVILTEISDKRMKRKDIGLTYRLTMIAEKHGEKIDWYKINTAIIDRWSRAGLKYIKEFAWYYRGVE